MTLHRRGGSYDAHAPQVRLYWTAPPRVKLMLLALAVIAFAVAWPR
jgi:hypothetical protein